MLYCILQPFNMNRLFGYLTFCVLLFSLASCKKDEVSRTPSEDVAVAKMIHYNEVHAADIPALFATEDVCYNPVSVLNWAEQYPYLPQVEFAVAHNGSNLFIHYRVTEKRTIGTMENDLEPTYKESCCEFFCMEMDDSLYYNIESNCIGSILMQCGKNRSERETSTGDNLRQIERWASLGRNSVDTINHETHWELALVVPLSAFWNHSYSTLSGKTFLVNVYNCVGSGDDRQYVTWKPVPTASPDFHRPEYFEPIYFEE